MILATTVARDLLIMAINLRISCPAAFDISLLTRRTSLTLFIGGLLLKEFQRGHENRIPYSKNSVHPTDMPEFVGICQMPTIPSDEKITPVKRCRSQMQGISLRVVRHHTVGNIGVNDLSNGFVQIDEWKVGNQCQRRVTVWKLTAAELRVHCQASHQFI